MIEIAHIHTDFPAKFGIPRQSGLVDELRGEIVFTEGFRDPNALRGIEGFSHLWLVWVFSENVRQGFSPTVRPPRLGGNAHMGVFATRSPFRPNPIGLSCVKLEEVRLHTPKGPVLCVSGVDMLDGTPILDIKPYIPYTDSRPDAVGGFSDAVREYALDVQCDEKLLSALPPEKRKALLKLLAQDPRPGYRHEDGRVCGFAFAGCEVRFAVQGNVLTVLSIE